jgi:DUF1680 family protein
MDNIIQDQLLPSPAGTTKITGYLGDKLDTCIRNGIMAADFTRYIVPFSDKTDEGGIFGGEFWGKWFTSAALAYRYQPVASYREILDKAVDALMQTQEPNGRISSCHIDFEFWDIWGRKYALLGLIAYFDQTGRVEALDAAARAADQLIDLTGPGKQKLTEAGLAVMEAIQSSSILEPLVLLYQRTGNKKYLDFSQHLVSLWSEPNRYTSKGMRLLEDALLGVDPARISFPKAYEMMSCYEGVCELYRATGEKAYLEAVVKFAQSVRKKELMIVGSGSSAELWCSGAFRQTMMLEQPMETCVTVTWVKLCYQLLRLTGDPIWADEMEVSLYNALLGAMMPDGNWWAYFSPLLGERMPSPTQVPLVQSSCCVVNGPRGLMTVPGWSVMIGVSGPVINLYSEGIWHCRLNSGEPVTLVQKTRYPETDSVEIQVHQEKAQVYTLRLRIPAWSQDTQVAVNGEQIPCIPGKYLEISREWQDQDKITLTFDLRGRVVVAPGDANHLAVMRGPVALALDNRAVTPDNINLWLLHSEVQWKHDDQLDVCYVIPEPVSTDANHPLWIDLKPCESKPLGVWMAFEVPFFYRPTHFFNHQTRSMIFYDYASAGNAYSDENFLRVWLPQPMFLNQLFPQGSWKVLDYTSTERPYAPKRKGISK